MSKKNILVTTSLLPIFMMSTGVATAFEDQAWRLEEIVVTAQKREERLQDAPLSVTAFSAGRLERAGFSELSEVAHFTPGMHWENINISKPQVFIWGMGTTGFDAGGDPSVAVYVDEVYMARFTGMSTELLDVERVEVLKGPQGTLFGRNAAGGAVSVVTQRPTETPSAKFRVAVGNYNLIDIKGTVSGPLFSDRVLARLSVSSRDSDGYVDVIGSPEDAFDSNRTYARGQLEFIIDDDSTLLITGDGGRVREGMWGMKNSGQLLPQVHPAVSGTVVLAPGLFEENYNFNGFQHSDTWGLSAKYETELSFATLTTISAFRNSKLNEITDFDASSADAIRRQFSEDSDSFQQEIRLTSPSSSERLSWIFGLYYFHETVDRLGQFFAGVDNTFVIGIGPFPGNGGMPFSNLDTRTIKTDSYAAFGQATYAVTDDLNVTLGARYSHDKKSMDRVAQTVGAPDAVNPFMQAGFAITAEDSWSSFDPSVTVDYSLSENAMLYASYKRGYKSGGFQSDPVVNGTAAQVIFDPEKVSSFEVGFKAGFLDNRVQLNGAAFYNKYKNLQFLSTVSLGDGGFASLIDNIAESEAKGFELELSAVPVENLLIDLGYAYLDSAFQSYVTPSGLDLSGHQTTRSPEHTFNGNMSYTVPLESGNLTLEGSISYTSDFFFEASNPAVFAQSESYSLVDAQLSYETDDERWRISLWGKNLTDKAYRTHNITIVVVPDPLLAAALDTYARPRTYGVSITWNYDQ